MSRGAAACSASWSAAIPPSPRRRTIRMGRESEPVRGRALEDRIVLDASVEAVWRALTDAEELMRWFPLQATVEPGVGGTITLSWGESGAGGATIAIWEPNRRLRTVESRRDKAGRLVEI